MHFKPYGLCVFALYYSKHTFKPNGRHKLYVQEGRRKLYVQEGRRKLYVQEGRRKLYVQEGRRKLYVHSRKTQVIRAVSLPYVFVIAFCTVYIIYTLTTFHNAVTTDYVPL